MGSGKPAQAELWWQAGCPLNKLQNRKNNCFEETLFLTATACMKFSLNQFTQYI
jgi:hypothetical protein